MANKRGFGNARQVRKLSEDSMKKAMSRENFDPSNPELHIFDVLGDPPSNNPKLKPLLDELNSKIGWKSIKDSVNDLITLADKNYNRELSGEPALPFFVNRLFLGNPGTGKTTCANLYGRFLKALNILSIGDVVIKTASDFVGNYVGQSSNKTVDILKLAQGKVLVIDEAYNLDDNMYGKQVLDTLVEKVQGTPNDDIAVLLLGYRTQMLNMLRNQNPGLSRRFPQEYAFNFEDYTDNELLKIFNDSCDKQGIQSSSYEVAQRAIRVLSMQRSLPNFGNAGSVNTLLQNAVSKATSRQQSSGDGFNAVVLIPEDIESGDKGNQDPFAPLDNLHNVENIREMLETLQNSLIVAQREGEASPSVGHFVFLGSPGTGKTTVARVMSKILFHMGMIATDRIVETSGLNITAEYVGQTKKKVHDIMGEAKGGILFIDEAYELGKGHYGEEAMTTLLEGMTSPDYKGLVIIIAGYEKDINEMLDRNAGLKSRFTRYFPFHDWFPEHCVSFLLSLAQKENFNVDQDVNDLLHSGFETLKKLPGWGNGRDVTQLWKDILIYRASRVVNSPENEKTISTDDVHKALEDMKSKRINQPTEKPRMTQKNLQPPPAVQQAPPAFQKAPPVQQAPPVTSTENQQKQLQNLKDEEKSKPEVEVKPVTYQRDQGVSDQDWEELELAKKNYNEKMERLKKEKDEKARLEEERKAKALQEKVRKICPCPAGFSWFQVGGGWRCGGGSHFVSDKQLNDQFTTDK